MEFQSGEKYYFWNRRTGDLDYLYINEVFDDSFTFYYRRNSRLYTVSFSYAEGKLFRKREDLPGYNEWWEREYSKNLQKRNPPSAPCYYEPPRESYKPRPSYTPHPDSWVVFGD